MIEIYNLVTKVVNASQTTKIYIVSGTIIVSCVAGLVSKCNENAELRARIEHMESIRKIDANIKEIKDLTKDIKAPTLEDVEKKNEAVNNDVRDSHDITF
jgi:mannitol-specific phosphotransferase system IIBC component